MFGDWSPSGDRFALRGLDRVSMYATATGVEVLTLSTPGVRNQKPSFSPDGSQLITTSFEDGSARLWDTETGEQVSILTGLTQGKGVSWSPSGEYATVIGVDGSIRIWDTVTGFELQKFPFFGPDFGLALWSPTEDRIYAAGDVSNEIGVFKLSAALSSKSGMRGLVGGVSWSPDGGQVSTGYQDGTVVIRDAESWEEVMTLETGTKYAGVVVWSPSGDRLLTCNNDGTTRIWDAVNGDLLLEFSGHQRQVFSGTWSPDGSRVATTEPGGDKIVIWDPESGEEILQIDLVEAVVAVWSPDGTRIATTSWSGHGSIRDAVSGEVQLSFFLEDDSRIVEGPAWSHDGKKLVIFSEGDGWIFDTTSGEQLVELSSGFTSSVWVVYWSPGDERIFTIGGDGTFRVFEAATGLELLVYDLGGWPAGTLSPDGRQMAIGTNDGKTSLYPTWLTKDELIAYAKECCLVRELTPEEREVFGLPER